MCLNVGNRQSWLPGLATAHVATHRVFLRLELLLLSSRREQFYVCFASWPFLLETIRSYLDSRRIAPESCQLYPAAGSNLICLMWSSKHLPVRLMEPVAANACTHRFCSADEPRSFVRRTSQEMAPNVKRSMANHCRIPYASRLDALPLFPHDGW